MYGLTTLALALVPGVFPGDESPVTPASIVLDSHGVSTVDGELRAAGASYEATFDAQGMTFYPALGASAPSVETLRFEARSVRRAAGADGVALEPATPFAEDSRVGFARGGGVTEYYDVRPEGIEQSFLLDEPIRGSGDLIIRCDLAGSLAGLGQPTADGGLRFEEQFGGVQLGAVTGIDAEGAHVAGSLRSGPGWMELVLPGSFVDRAAWPILVDPLIGTNFPVSVALSDDHAPDIAFEETSQTYLVVWKRTFSATSSSVRGQRMNKSGSLLGSTLFFNTGGGVVGDPKVASINFLNRFLVAWDVEAGGFDQVRAESCDAFTGTLSGAGIVANAIGSCFDSVDVGGASRNDPSLSDGLIVYHRTCGSPGIIVSPMGVPAIGIPFPRSALTLATQTSLVNVTASPSISKTGGALGQWLVAWRSRRILPASDWEINAVAIGQDGGTLSPILSVTSNLDDELAPVVDGGATLASEFVVLYGRTLQNGFSELEMTALTLDGGNLVNRGASIVGSSLTSIQNYDVAWTPGIATAVWSTKAFLSSAVSVWTRDFNSVNAQACRPTDQVVSLTPSSGGIEVAIASQASGGRVGVGDGMLSYGFQGVTSKSLYGRLFDSLPPNGSVVSVGGSCGFGGSIVDQGDPSIGNGFFQLTLIGADPASSITILNITPFLTPFACGPCDWLPFDTTFIQPTLNGASQSVLRIPCDVGLVGATYGAQFTTVTPSASPCSLKAFVSVSDIVHVTIGG